MVYTGKPSKSCEACRLRKRRVSRKPPLRTVCPLTSCSKCDKATPGCGQCRRQGAPCPGYRDLLSLSFRNETDRVISKVQSSQAAESSTAQAARHGRYSSTSSVSASSGPESSALISSSSSSPPIPSIFQIDLSDLGMTYFYDNYATAQQGCQDGFLQVAPRLLAADRWPPAMTAAIESISLAGIANSSTPKVDRNGLLSRAWSKYCEALRAVNNALANPATACKDSTLYAILLLSIFESITCTGPSSEDAWRRHLEGAAALIVKRGFAQFQSPEGAMGFREALIQILTSCYRLGLPVPDQIRNMRREIDNRPPSLGTPISAMSKAHMDALDLWQRMIKPDWPLARDEWESFMAEALALEQISALNFEQFLRAGNLEKTFRTIYDPDADPDLVFKGMYHVYPDTSLARIWVGMRASQTLNYRLIRSLVVQAGPDCSFAAFDATKEELLERIDLELHKMGMALLAAIPQLLGYVTPEGLVVDKERAKPHVAGAYYGIFHLYHVGQLPHIDESARKWSIQCLRTIEASTGNKKAGFLADVLERDGRMEY